MRKHRETLYSVIPRCLAYRQPSFTKGWLKMPTNRNNLTPAPATAKTTLKSHFQFKGEPGVPLGRVLELEAAFNAAWEYVPAVAYEFLAKSINHNPPTLLLVDSDAKPGHGFDSGKYDCTLGDFSVSKKKQVELVLEFLALLTLGFAFDDRCGLLHFDAFVAVSGEARGGESVMEESLARQWLTGKAQRDTAPCLAALESAISELQKMVDLYAVPSAPASEKTAKLTRTTPLFSDM